MKRYSIYTVFLFILCFPQLSFAQYAHKLGISIDGSFGLHYFSGAKQNPLSSTLNLGYQYNLNYFLGIELGVRMGGFYQDLGQQTLASQIEPRRAIYKGTTWGPYIAPKIYFPIRFQDAYGRADYIYLENKFSYLSNSLSLAKLTDEDGTKKSTRFNYELKLGWQRALSKRWALNIWVGYNSFKIGKIESQLVRSKNTTPIQMGVGFVYTISTGEKEIKDLKLGI